MNTVHIIVNEWMGYPLYRSKYLGENIIKCGLSRLLHNLATTNPGIDYRCTIVVNESDESPKIGLVSDLAAKWPLCLRLGEFSIPNPKYRYEKLASKYEFVEKVYYRPNTWQDIGAYDFGLQKLRKSGFCGDVIFVNSSVCGPFEVGWLQNYHELFRRKIDTGLCGITINSNFKDSVGDVFFRPHIQSFFLYSSMEVLNSVFPDRLVDIESDPNKIDIILKGEVGITQKILQAGYGIRSKSHPDFYYKIGDEWSIPWGDMRTVKHNMEWANRI